MRNDFSLSVFRDLGRGGGGGSGRKVQKQKSCAGWLRGELAKRCLNRFPGFKNTDIRDMTGWGLRIMIWNQMESNGIKDQIKDEQKGRRHPFNSSFNTIAC